MILQFLFIAAALIIEEQWALSTKCLLTVHFHFATDFFRLYIQQLLTWCIWCNFPDDVLSGISTLWLTFALLVIFWCIAHMSTLYDKLLWRGFCSERESDLQRLSGALNMLFTCRHWVVCCYQLSLLVLDIDWVGCTTNVASSFHCLLACEWLLVPVSGG